MSSDRGTELFTAHPSGRCRTRLHSGYINDEQLVCSGQPIARFLASGQPEPTPIYGIGRHGYQPPLVYPSRTPDGTWAQAVTITIPIPEGACAEFEIVAIAS